MLHAISSGSVGHCASPVPQPEFSLPATDGPDVENQDQRIAQSRPRGLHDGNGSVTNFVHPPHPLPGRRPPVAEATRGPGVDPVDWEAGIEKEYFAKDGKPFVRLTLTEYGLVAEVPIRKDIPPLTERDIQNAIERVAADNRVFAPELPDLYEARHQITRKGHGTFFGSPYHALWVTAFHETVGGKIPHDAIARLDPFGGLAGGGPRTVGDGFTGPLRQVAFWHDMEWVLARHFGVGEFADRLRWDIVDAAPGMGRVGLDPISVRKYLQDYRLITLLRTGGQTRP